MKKYNSFFKWMFTSIFVFLFISVDAQNEYQKPVWQTKTKSQKVIVENKGQFSDINAQKVLFANFDNTEEFYFTAQGLIIKLDTVLYKKPWAKKVLDIFDKEKETEREYFKETSYYLYAEWQNTNPDVKIETSEKTEGYYTFGLHKALCNGYQKITYKNIYPNIDIEYTIPNDSAGIKYNLILHPGADVSNISLKYSGDVTEMLQDNNGNIIIKNPLHNIIEHAPKSYYSDASGDVASSYILSDKTITFFLSNTNQNQTLIIDPWISGITGYTDPWGWDVEYDWNNNLYVYFSDNVGGSNGGLYVIKFSPTGTLLWTHTVTTSPMFEGNFMLDKLANKIYISEGFNGSGATAYRIDLAGVPDGFVSQQNGSFREMWDMTFDCNLNRIIGLGGGTMSNLNGGLINPTTGAVSLANFTGVGGICQDIACQTVDNQGQVFVVYAYGTDSPPFPHTISLVNSTLNGNVWQVPHGMWGFYECSNHINGSCSGPGSNAFNGLDVNNDYLYYYDGQGLAAFNKATGANIAAISVGYSGQWYSPLTQGGIAVDDCNNVYVGGPNSNILMCNFNGSTFSAFQNMPLGWAGNQSVFDIKYDKNTNFLYVSGHSNVGVFNATLSSSCTNNSISNTTVCTGPQIGDGTVTVSTTISNPLITYTWYDSGNNIISTTSNSTSLTNTVTGLANGTYIVHAQINPACGPMVIDTVIIDCPTCGGTITPTMVSCFGGNNGTATFTTLNGQSPFTYLWSTSSTNTSISGLIAGIYTITLTDANTCTSVVTTTITQPSLVQPTISSVTDVTCYGGSDGSITVSTVGGTPPYSVLWDNGQLDSTAINLSIGQYNVTITDANGCTGTQTSTITQPPQLVISATASPSAVCPGDSSTLTASGAATYLWSGIGLSTTIGTSVNATPAGTTTYYVTGTDATGCTAITQVTVTVNAVPNVTLTGTSPICDGQSSNLIAGGANTYVWDNGLPPGGSNSVSPPTTTIYNVTGTDLNGCVNTAQFIVTVNAMPIANAGNDTAVCQLTNVMNATPSVGIGLWTIASGGNGSFSQSDSSNAVFTVGNTGVYTLVWTENNFGCIDDDTVVVQLTQPPTSDFTMTPVACTGDASIVTYIGTGDALSTFVWTWGGATAVPGSGIGFHSANWGMTNWGTQTVGLIVSINNCPSAQTLVTVTNPTPLTSTISHIDILCNGQQNGSVTPIPSGGTGAYTYHWNYLSSTQPVLTGLLAGIYTVTITDANLCTTVNGANVIEPAKFIIGVTLSQNICLGQCASLNISATGGTQPYQYFWDGLPSNSYQSVCPDTTTSYTATALDGNNCPSNVATTTVNVSPALLVTLNANTDTVCPGDPIMLIPIISGGVGPPYMIIDQTGNVVTPPVYIYPEQSGWYSVYVQDACGTHDTSSVHIWVMPLPPAGALANPTQGCQPLTVQFNEQYSDSERTFVWDFGDNENLSLAKNPIHVYEQSGTFTVTLTVTSKYGCKNVVTYTDLITVWPKPQAHFIWSPEFASVIKPVLTFTDMTINGVPFYWTFGDGDSSSVANPTHRFSTADTFYVQLISISDKGCLDTVVYPIDILEEWTFYAPTAFSPDNDTKNDSFWAFAHGIKETGFYFAIYDRWGEVIWETTKYSKLTEQSEKWDGRAKNHNIVQVGTYTWLAKFKDFRGNDHEKTGAVTVVR